MLNLHPEIFVFPETHWIPKMYEAFGTGPGCFEDLVSIVERTHHVTGEPVTALEASRLEKRFCDLPRPTVRQFCDRLGRMFAEDAGKMDWADKTPDYGPYLTILQNLWPECRFVHVIRDGTAVVASMAGHPGYRWLASAAETWWCPASFNGYYTAVREADLELSHFVKLWYRRLSRIRDELGRLEPASFREIRFEDLIDAPEETVSAVAAFLELDPNAEWLSRAVQEVQPDRIHSKPSVEVIGLLTESQRNLLSDLGYMR